MVPFREAKGNLLKLCNRHCPSTIQPRSPPFGLRSIVFGIFLCEILKVRALFCLFHHVFRIHADLGHFRVGLPHGLEENVLGMDAILHLVVVYVLIGNNRAVRRRRLARNWIAACSNPTSAYRAERFSGTWYLETFF